MVKPNKVWQTKCKKKAPKEASLYQLQTILASLNNIDIWFKIYGGYVLRFKQYIFYYNQSLERWEIEYNYSYYFIFILLAF
jgi:hypothetical protein